jgi:AraC-like DNA-binding protein
MQFYTYEIQSPALRPFIEFILFNYACRSVHTSVTYYPNTDICLGIIRQKELAASADGFFIRDTHKSISSYLTGIYCQPHKLTIDGTFDEICLPFTPLGYYHFIDIPLKTYILDDNVLEEAFGVTALTCFESVFETTDFQKRGRLIESFLANKMKSPANDFISLSLHSLHTHNGNNSLKEITRQLQCSEKKLQRAFKNHFDIMPKQYAQVLKFRQALKYISLQQKPGLTDTAYESGYYDQSHFIKNVRRFSGTNPGALQKLLQTVDGKVLLTTV